MRAKKNRLPEGLFSSLTDEKFALPNPWQTVYYEGIRGNHILFSKVDQTAFRDAKASLDLVPKPLEDSVLKLIKCPDVSSARLTINGMPYKRREALFSIYKRALNDWRDFVKTRMN